MDLSALCSFSITPLLFSHRNPNSNLLIQHRRSNRRRNRAPFMAISGTNRPQSPTRLVTFLGKGGSGKTTAAVLAAQYYAKEGYRTCLVIHSQDLTADQLLDCKIGTSPTSLDNNLSAVRLETSKMLLEPLNRVKKVDGRLNLTQGVLEAVVGEELGVLPGMDSIFSALALEKMGKFLPGERNSARPEFDIIVYDGISTEETLRLIGATERVRWYLKYMRDLSEKTDIGRLTAPSLLKLAYESAGGSNNGKTSNEIWNDIEQILEKASASFTDSSRFGCYLVMDPSRTTSVNAAMRYWGCAIQAGSEISGAFMFAPHSSTETKEVAGKISPLPFALVPYINTDSTVDWHGAIDSLDKDVKDLFTMSKWLESSVRFDPRQKTVTLFMPGFNKSEIKLYQYRGGSELLVEAGDQRRIIRLPHGMQGKVGGAKFINRNLVVTLRDSRRSQIFGGEMIWSLNSEKMLVWRRIQRLSVGVALREIWLMCHFGGIWNSIASKVFESSTKGMWSTAKTCTEKDALACFRWLFWYPNNFYSLESPDNRRSQLLSRSWTTFLCSGGLRTK